MHEKRQGHDPGGDPADRPAPPGAQQHDRGPEQIELFLDAERPQMQERLESSRSVKVTRFAPQEEIRHEHRACRDVLQQLLVVEVGEREPSEHGHGQQHDGERRDDAPNAPDVEVEQADPAAIGFVEEEAGDQKPGDDEEHIHADKSTRKGARRGMEGSDGQHGDRAQTVDVGAILQGMTALQRPPHVSGRPTRTSTATAARCRPRGGTSPGVRQSRFAGPRGPRRTASQPTDRAR